MAEKLQLDPEKHIRYWHRCLKTVLPTQYTSTDSSRMTLAFFILAALDLLRGPEIPHADRTRYRDWIISCQHPSGGFCGSPNHRFPDRFYVDVGNGGREMDPPNLPATFFALLSLGFVESGKPFARVRRTQLLQWLKRCQREDGSFGELVQDGKIQGGRDMRYCYCAAAIRWMLRRELEGKNLVEDIDVDKLVEHIRLGQTYDGGVSESSRHEAHAGYTYCAIAALALLDRSPSRTTLDASQTQSIEDSQEKLSGLTNVPDTIRWLVSRQTGYLGDDESDEEDEEGSPDISNLQIDETQFIGFNGRCNKRADTCYSFWVSASLSILGLAQLTDQLGTQQFLLEHTQHQIGGFGKCPGDPPDIYHSYLGLAALGTLGDPLLKDFDPVLCVSLDARRNIDR